MYACVYRSKRQFTMKVLNLATKVCLQVKQQDLITFLQKSGRQTPSRNSSWRSATIYSSDCPNVWRQGAVIPILIKGDLSDRQNYKCISLLPAPFRIDQRMILSRSNHISKLNLRMNQNGCRERRPNVGHIRATRRITRGRGQQPTCHKQFADFHKAFGYL